MYHMAYITREEAIPLGGSECVCVCLCTEWFIAKFWSCSIIQYIHTFHSQYRPYSHHITFTLTPTFRFLSHIDYADREAVTQGKVEGVVFNDETMKREIFKFSDEFGLNELYCVDYFVASQLNTQILKELESTDYLRKHRGYYDLSSYGKTLEAARDLYRYEKTTMLETLLLLMRMRVERKESERKEGGNMIGGEGGGNSDDQIIQMSDDLLNNKKFCNKLIKKIKEKYTKLHSRFTEAANAGADYVVSNLDRDDFNDLKVFSTILFYALHDDDKAEDEIRSLQELIFTISNDLTKGNDFLLSMDGAESINAWQVPAHEMLVVLQLTHVHVVKDLTDKVENAGKCYGVLLSDIE